MSNKLLGTQDNFGDSVNVGHSHYIISRRIVAVLESGSMPMRRLRERAQKENTLVDATAGRKTRSLVVMDSGHIILSALAPHTLQERLRGDTRLSPALLEVEEGQFVS